MKPLKECDVCEKAVKLMCLAPVLGGAPDCGTHLMPPWLRAPLLPPNTSAAPRACSQPGRHRELVPEPRFPGRVSRPCVCDHSHAHTCTLWSACRLAPARTPGSPGL